jgi:hypothetical protein
MQIAKAKASIPAEAANARKEGSNAYSGLRAEGRWSNIVPPDVLFGSACGARLVTITLRRGAQFHQTGIDDSGAYTVGLGDS